MLLILLYHRIGEEKFSNPKKIFSEHLQYIADNYPVILPGEPLGKGLSICLTFDDAFFDFYTEVFPLLQKMNLRALLGVPTQYIMEKSSISYKERLSIPYYRASQDGVYQKKTPYCTWEELREINASGHVEIASHSHSHPNLTLPFCNFKKEISDSKKLLEENLPQAISTFIYPFGKYSPKVHQTVMQEYAYALRIGNALNSSWENQKRPLARVNGDQLLNPKAPFSWRNLSKYFLKHLIYTSTS